MNTSRRRLIPWFGALLLTLAGCYSNHFGNAFQFDDSHAVVENPAIRTLANVPRFFTDVRTFSRLPSNQSYRPLVTTSLAVDYALGGGLKPFWFHASTLVWFLTQIVLLYMLSLTVFDSARPDARNWWLAWLVAAVYGLHPVSAETVNYIVQRGDLYATLGIVAGVAIYARAPGLRRYGLYLLPALAGMFAKPTALVFAPILLIYIVVIDRVPLISGIRRSLPAFALCAAFSYLEKALTPTNFFHTTFRTYDYWITQPYVTLRYFRSFFLPLYLSADTDLPAFRTLWDVRALAGLGFCGLLVAAAWWTARQREWRPVSFGLWWFLIALIPTAVYPLAEVENDHRMFLPFVGLTLAVVWSAGWMVRQRRRWELAGMCAAVLVLAGFAWGTHRRNEVWRNHETLWRDVTGKSPKNPRGHFNLALGLARDPNRFQEAIAEYQAASADYAPDDFVARNNVGLALSRIPGGLPAALAVYREALRINPDFATAHVNLGDALSRIPGGLSEALSEYTAAVRIKPDYAVAHNNLGLALSKIPDRLPEAISEYEAALRIDPSSAEIRTNLGDAFSRIPGRRRDAIAQFEAALRIKPDPAVQQRIDRLRDGT